MHVVVSERSLQMNGISTTELYESECSILAKSLGYEGTFGENNELNMSLQCLRYRRESRRCYRQVSHLYHR